MKGEPSIADLVRRVARIRSSPHDVFRDFCAMSAAAISNAVDPSRREEREADYMRIVGKYSPEEAALFPEMLGRVVGELESGHQDVLGKAFMELEIGNKHAGQFFTPYSLCKAMAAMQVDESLAAAVRENGFVTLGEPAVGAGGLVIAFAEAMLAAGMNPQRQLHVTAQDVDAGAAHMAYVQLSLLGIPAVVVVGDTLRMETRSVWLTPAHVLGSWGVRLAGRREAVGAPTSPPPTEWSPSPEPADPDQLGLFGPAP